MILPQPLCGQVLDRCKGREERGGGVDGHAALPLADVHFPELDGVDEVVGADGLRADPGVVDEDVEAAEPFDRVGDEFCRGVFLGEVGGQGKDGVVPAYCPGVVGGVFEDVGIHVVHGHAGAGLREGEADGPAHTPFRPR